MRDLAMRSMTLRITERLEMGLYSLRDFLIHTGFLEKRSDYGMLKLRREFTSSKTKFIRYD